MADDQKSERPSDAEAATVPVACPHCSMHVGKPKGVSTRRGDPLHVDVTMQCEQCNHIWIVQKLTHDHDPVS